jgi:proline racemase
MGGVPDVTGKTMFEKKVYLETQGGHLRLLMLREPRGYAASCCNLIRPPSHPQADAGFVIMEQAEYPPMSGTNTICVVTVLIETGMVPVSEPVTRLKLDTPAGLIAEAAPLGFRLTPDEGRDIVRAAEMIKAAAREQLSVAHPDNPGISGVSIAQISGPPSRPEAHARNAVVVSTGTLDWSRPQSWITGFAQYVLDPDDPFPDGFTVGDIWGLTQPLSNVRGSE